MNVNKWDSVEKCLLEMLPVKNGVFRKLQELIEGLEVCAGELVTGFFVLSLFSPMPNFFDKLCRRFIFHSPPELIIQIC